MYSSGAPPAMATFETRERTGDDVATWFDDGRYPRLVAERDRRVVGWITASAYRPRDCYDGIAEFSVPLPPPGSRALGPDHEGHR